MSIWQWGITSSNEYLKNIINSSLNNLNLPILKTNGDEIKKQFVNLNNFLNSIYKVNMLGGSFDNKVNIITNLSFDILSALCASSFSF